MTVAVTAASPSALLFAPSDIAGMLLKSTGSFLESGLQESCAELWTSADDNGAADELRLASHWLSLCFLLWESYFPVGFRRSLFRLDCDGPGVGTARGGRVVSGLLVVALHEKFFIETNFNMIKI